MGFVDITNTDKKYSIVYADPPWKYGGGKNKKTFYGLASVHYETMKTKDICALPVNKIADDNSVLFLWVTAPQLPEGLKVMSSWGFKFKTVAFTWLKYCKNGRPVFGLGFWTHGNAEFCLIGTRGKIKRQGTAVSSVIQTQRLPHSKKPDETRDRIVELMGDLPRIELFARDQYEGWDCWGNEVE